MDPAGDGRKPRMGCLLESHRSAAAARHQGHGHGSLHQRFHQLAGPGHGPCRGHQGIGDRLAHRQQRRNRWSRQTRLAHPGDHLLGALEPPPATQRQQRACRQLKAEVGRRRLPRTGMQGLGVEQQAVEIKQAGGGAAHRAILSADSLSGQLNMRVTGRPWFDAAGLNACQCQRWAP
jgi:hypothetical protein